MPGPSRISADCVVGDRGRQFIRFLSQVSLAIVNGTDLGGGNLTTATHVVDYACANDLLWPRLRSMAVLELGWFSDHKPICLSIEWKTQTTTTKWGTYG
jgi:hypothetical protein